MKLTKREQEIVKKISKGEITDQLQRTSEIKYICETTKTDNGVRDVPMTPDVVDAFKRIIKNRPKPIFKTITRENMLYFEKK